MSSENRMALLAGLASVLVLAGCPGSETPTPDGGITGGEGDSCIDDSDCPDKDLFFCNTTTSTCQPACRSKADCSSSVRGEFALAYCDSNPLGCQCDEGACTASLCSADADCGDAMVCRDGACVNAPDVSTVASCQVTPDFALVKSGEPVQFWVSFWDASNKPVVLQNANITWAPEGNRVTGNGTGTTATFTGGTAGAAENAVKVTAGGATCFAKVSTLDSNVPAGQIRVTAVNELTGRPVENAAVLVSEAATGAQLTTGTTGNTGTVNVTAAGEVTVSVFHGDYTYVSVVKYSTTTGSRDLFFSLRRNLVDLYGGYKGTFDNVPKTANVHAGIAAMSIPGSAIDISVAQLLGHTVPTNITIGSAINEEDVPLPAGAFLGFTDQQIKSEVSAQGLAGVCTSALNGITDVEGAIRTGKCGTRSAWALSGDVPLGDLPISAVTGGVDNIDFGALLSDIIPVFKQFKSSIVRDVQFSLSEPGGTEGDPDFSNTSHFTAGVNHTFNGLPLGFGFVAEVPTLPKFRGDSADGVVVLGGADVKGRGLIPLGLGAGVNTDGNDKLDKQAELSKEGQVIMRMAPTHSGIEGAQYSLVALAMSLQSVNDASAGLAVSAVQHKLANNKLAFDPTGNVPIVLPAGFMNFPENAKYNFTDTPQPGLVGRTFKFTTNPDLSSASLIRIQFTDRGERRWHVLTDSATAVAGFVLPKPPSGFGDRTFFTGSTSGSRSQLLVQAIKLENGGSAISLKNLVELNGTNANRLGDFITAFSVIDYTRPEVEWVEPVDGATIAKGSPLKLEVSSFRIGTGASDDGYLKITFTGGSGCDPIDITTDASQGKGEVSATLSPSCAGAVEMTATLHGKDNQPIAPVASSRLAVTIQ
ncbi:MAG: hypothetical protein WBV82_12375 [Myxococcaceae bacterium]